METEKEIRTEKWGSGKYNNKSKNRVMKYQYRQFSYWSIDNKQHFYGYKTQINDGYKQLFKSTELSVDLLPKNERVYHTVHSNNIMKHRQRKHGVLRKDKVEKQRFYAKETNDIITEINTNMD
jgi:hypothetical protein